MFPKTNERGWEYMSVFAEYIWIDGSEPVAKLRSKTKVIEDPIHIESDRALNELDFNQIPVWGFDGSSTNQAQGSSSDCILKPARAVRDPIRGGHHILVLCEVLNADGEADKNNYRSQAATTAKTYKDDEPLFGIEQEYTLFQGHSPLGWPPGGYPAPQGPFYCGVGADEVFGREIVEEHMQACRLAGLRLSGVNAEVMPGQWEFQIGPADALTVSDHLWLARYLLYRIAEKYGVTVKLDPKPMEGDWNGAGAHTNFSTKAMREDGGIEACHVAAAKIGADASGDEVREGEIVSVNNFPKAYGYGYEKRLTGNHETCSHKDFKYGVADRTASIRIPLHVAEKGKGYIEDRRPCANIDPYQVCTYLIETVCG
jgi:glutamine synthetase